MGDGLDAFALPRAAQSGLLLEPLPSTPPEPVEDLLADVPAGDEPEEAPVAVAAPRTCDPHEFASLYMRHRWSFVRLAGRYLDDPRDADEVVQEAFLRLFLALPELENELVVLSYCRRTITNLCIDRLRADRRRPRLVNLSAEVVEQLADEVCGDPVEAAEDAVVVREALALLSPMHRAALIKREIEEKSLPQIAEELDIPADSVKHVLHRARRALRRLLVGTSVEPGVDLSVGVVLAANRERAEAACRSTGAFVLIMVMAALAVLGFVRQQGDEPAVEDYAAQLQTIDGQGRVIGPQGRIPGPAASTPGAPPAALPAPTSQPSAARTPSGTVAPSDEAAPERPQAAVKDGPTGTIDTSSPPPAGRPGQAAPSIALSGVPGAQTATLRQAPSTVLASGDTESTSEVVAESSQGRYSFVQTFVFDAQGAFVQVGLAEQVPTPNGTVRTVVPSAKVSTQEMPDGVLRVQVAGRSFTPSEQDITQEARTVLVDVLFSADRREILGQSLLVTDPSGEPVASASPSAPALPDVTATRRPTAAPSVSATPTPRPTASASVRKGEVPVPGSSVEVAPSAPADLP